MDDALKQDLKIGDAVIFYDATTDEMKVGALRDIFVGSTGERLWQVQIEGRMPLLHEEPRRLDHGFHVEGSAIWRISDEAPVIVAVGAHDWVQKIADALSKG